MKAWILLLFTIFGGYVTYQSIPWRRSIKRGPFSIISNLWGGRLDHLSMGEKNKIKGLYASSLYGMGNVVWLFLSITILLGYFTVQEFLR